MNENNGRFVKQEANTFLLSFRSATSAVKSAIGIQALNNDKITPDLEFKIGISAGFPVSHRENLFEDTIKKADHLSYVKDGGIVLSPEVKDLYESENQNNPANIHGIGVLTKSEMVFVTSLLEYTESVWSYSATSALDFSKNLGFSKSKLYRTMMQIVGKSPNVFLKEYRLNKALHLLNDQKSNISEIAYQTGFSSPTYFSKCFQEFYGILPSQHMKAL